MTHAQELCSSKKCKLHFTVPLFQSSCVSVESHGLSHQPHAPVPASQSSVLVISQPHSEQDQLCHLLTQNEPVKTPQFSLNSSD